MATLEGTLQCPPRHSDGPELWRKWSWFPIHPVVRPFCGCILSVLVMLRRVVLRPLPAQVKKRVAQIIHRLLQRYGNPARAGGDAKQVQFSQSIPGAQRVARRSQYKALTD